MPAYYRDTVDAFLNTDADTVVGRLQAQYATDGFASLFVAQTTSWVEAIPLLQTELSALVARKPEAMCWGLLIEYPLYRLRKRIDAVVLGESSIVIIEMKVGERQFKPGDVRQAEEYALDLRDFHRESRDQCLVPVLWATGAPQDQSDIGTGCSAPGVTEIVRVGRRGLDDVLYNAHASFPVSIVAETWDDSPYLPVPTMVEAATAMFSGHGVKALAQADATNLLLAAQRLVALVRAARDEGRRALMFLTGVPGSGKTLAGLHVVHSAVDERVEERGDIVYLSGNGPLVAVLREALARDDVARAKANDNRVTLANARRNVRTRIQHVNDFMKDAVEREKSDPPYEHVIVFDEAQRAWNAGQGKKKFGRDASEPLLLMEIMARHDDWCACICLVGGGQEINSGEAGIAGWGDALRAMTGLGTGSWTLYAPPDVLEGGPSTGGHVLGELPQSVRVVAEPDLALHVPMRSYRSPVIANWVDAVLHGAECEACDLAEAIGDYPVRVTRALADMRSWLRSIARGQRRSGLVASSAARRLRAEGIGEFLTAMDRDAIAQWYLNDPDDIRSSCALEVPANEYTCQGLELDFVGVCWGGDMMWDSTARRWSTRRLSGDHWQIVRDETRKRYSVNSYRVLLTRAREGMILWIPSGAPDDNTRDPEQLDATADYLVRCGAVLLGEDSREAKRSSTRPE